MQLICNPFLHLLRMILCENKPRYFVQILHVNIADNDEIVGLENPNSDAEKISEIIKTRMDPIPEFRLRFEQVEDGKV